MNLPWGKLPAWWLPRWARPPQWQGFNFKWQREAQASEERPVCCGSGRCGDRGPRPSEPAHAGPAAGRWLAVPRLPVERPHSRQRRTAARRESG